MQESQKTHRQGKRQTYGAKDNQVESVQVAITGGIMTTADCQGTAWNTDPNPTATVCPVSISATLA